MKETPSFNNKLKRQRRRAIRADIFQKSPKPFVALLEWPQRWLWGGPLGFANPASMSLLIKPVVPIWSIFWDKWCYVIGSSGIGNKSRDGILRILDLGIKVVLGKAMDVWVSVSRSRIFVLCVYMRQVEELDVGSHGRDLVVGVDRVRTRWSTTCTLS